MEVSAGLQRMEYNPALSQPAGARFGGALGLFQFHDIPDIVRDEQWTDACQYKNQGENNS
jgi:hypothetical protein